MERKLNEEQIKIVSASEDRIVVNASAGSGKTMCAVNRLLEILQRGIEPSKIVFITFTNAAAAEMRERAGEAAKDVFIGTIHSYANKILVTSGIRTDEIINNEEFDKLFNLVRENPWCIREVDYLILDEGQDSTQKQFEFLFDLIKPKQWIIFSDHRQSIYGFIGAEPDYIIHLMNDPKVKVYYLRNNYRSGESILDYAKSLIGRLGFNYTDNSHAMRPRPGRVIKTWLDKEKIANYILDTEGTFGDWFVLTRSNAELDNIYNFLEQKGIPCETFKKKDLTASDLKEKMKNDTVKVLTIHTAKGLEANKVIVTSFNCYNEEETRVAYVAATRARDLLIWGIGSAPKRKRGYRQKIMVWDDAIDSWE